MDTVLGLDEAGRGCERPDAEVLTQRGWLTYDQLKLEDSVMSYFDDGSIQWQPIQHVWIKDYEGDLVELKHRSAHIVVTSDHYFTVLKRKSRRDKVTKKEYVFDYIPHYVPLNQIADNDALPRTGNWESKDYSWEITLPALTKDKANYRPSITIPLNTWIRFLGLYLSEGSCYYAGKGDYRVLISQLENSQYYKEMKSVMEAMPFHYTCNKRDFTIHSKQLFQKVKGLGDVYNKYIPKEIKELNPDLLRELLWWLMRGDGNFNKTGRRKTELRYYTSSERLRDDIEEIAVKAGFSPRTIIKTKAGESGGKIRGREITATVNNYQITLARSKTSSFKHLLKKKAIIPYKGKVFCLSLLKAHNFLVRRSGKSYFTGNSAIGPLVMYGVVVQADQSDYLIGQKIADSKKYKSCKTRTDAAKKIRRLCSYTYRIADAAEVDKYVNKKKLNVLERKMAEEIIHEVISGLEIPIAQVVLDGYDMFSPLEEIVKNKYGYTTDIRAYDKAESKSLAVAAASVCAKAKRDQLTKAIMGDYFNKGAGYCNEGTKEWLQYYIDTGDLDSIEKNIRWSFNWKALNTIKKTLGRK